MNLFIMLKISILFFFNKNTLSWGNLFLNKISNLQNKNHNNVKQYIISCKNNNIYSDNAAKLFLDENKFLFNKKLITVSPGGFKGFYLLGILTFIKETYETNDLIYSGASAGAWNSLFMCYKGNSFPFIYNLLDNNIKKSKSILELEYFIKYKLLSNYNDDDFDLNKLFIGVTTIQNLIPRTNIFSDFDTLEDAINCCVASSHIPFITGGITNKYHNMFTFDGGFSKYPYLDRERLIHISPSMWNNADKVEVNTIKKNMKKYSEIFSISKNNLLELFDDGYYDAKKNKQYLDTIFIPKLKLYSESDGCKI